MQRARQDGYRSRASYKLLEIDDKYRLIKPGMTVVDLGAAPGGWSQVAVRRLEGHGTVVALDILEMEPVDDVKFIQGDFTEDEPLEALITALDGTLADLVISDMAPNLSGMKEIDQPRVAYLVELAIDLSDRILAPGGAFVAKCFEGEGIGEIRASLKRRFERCNNFKPKASRGRSREIYLVGCGHIGTAGV
ncbi:MAG: RlmE family RNA methyltransferase [Gammaproteobacteria bacterium]|nr:RlmE family RNA methyltransferase [Gammaproteobacteria bacterium]